MQYGISYKGSKNKIADKIIELMPEKNNFYDLFAGGCSITHAALLSRKYKNIFTNDIQSDIINLFRGAINGEYKNERRWISREDFFNLKDNDPYIKYIWSFGNKGKTYLYSEDIEPYKKALHFAICFNDLLLLKSCYPAAEFTFLEDIQGVNRRRLAFQRYFKASGAAAGTPLESSADCASLLQNLARLQNLERLESLERLKRLNKINTLEGLQAQRLIFSNKSYEEIEIKENSLIYCDIPYKDTDGYNDAEFDFTAFYNWAAAQQELLIISSYEMPAPEFAVIAEIPHRCTLNGNIKTDVTERLFIPQHQLQLYKKNMPQPLLFEEMIF